MPRVADVTVRCRRLPTARLALVLTAILWTGIGLGRSAQAQTPAQL